MRITTLASVAIPCLGFSVSSMAAEDVMIVTASGYEKKINQCSCECFGDQSGGLAIQPVS